MSTSNFISKGLKYAITAAMVAYIIMLIVKINHFATFGIASKLFMITLAVLAAFVIARAFVAVKNILS